MTNLKNKVALVTGSGRGIGKAIAERYACLGADVIVNYMNDKESAEKNMVKILKYGVRAMAIKANVSKVNDLKSTQKCKLLLCIDHSG